MTQSAKDATNGPPAGTAEQLGERLLGAAIGTLELASVYLGGRLGFYRALAGGAELTPGELAGRTGTSERYVREWLEQQAVAGILAVGIPPVGEANADPERADANADAVYAEAAARRYRLPAEYEELFVHEESPAHLTPLAMMTVGVITPIDELVEAFRSGEGVPYARYGSDVRNGIAGLNRPQFGLQLAGWLASVPAIDERLRSDPPARVADLACGQAWSSIAIARAYPKVLVDAVDDDAESIRQADRNVEAAGLSERIAPRLLDAAGSGAGPRYDLVTIFEAVHDLAHPVEVLASVRSSLAEGGVVFIADEKVADRFTAPGDEVERMNYGWSVLHCLPAGLSDPGSVGTGTVMRQRTLVRYATEAGFSRATVLPIEHDFWRFTVLEP
jgi:SAM-dependent methyltransferase